MDEGSQDCPFCHPDGILFENDLAYAMLDRYPVNPGHLRIITKREVAGQTMAHVHLHLIPRYRGDTENPRGGVRGVIPSRQSY